MKFIIFRIVLILFLVNGATAYATEVRPLQFARVPATSTMNVQLFEPLIDYLQKTLKRPVQFVLTKNYTDLLNRFGRGEIDIVFGGPYTFIEARDQYGAQAIAIRMLGGRGVYQSVIFVKEGSGIRSLQDLQGKRFAFSDPFSTSGYLVPRAMMAKEGITDPNRFFSQIKFKYTYNDLIESVLLGEVDAAATASFQFEGFGLRKQHLRKISVSQDLILGPIYVNTLSLSPDEIKAIKKAFLAIGKTPQTQELAKIINTPEFRDVPEGTYDWVLEYREIVRPLPPIQIISERLIRPKFQMPSFPPGLNATILLTLFVGVSLILIVLLLKYRRRLSWGLGRGIFLYSLILILLVVTSVGGLYYLNEKESLKRNTEETRTLFTQSVVLFNSESIVRGNKTSLTQVAHALVKEGTMNILSVSFYGKERVLLAASKDRSGSVKSQQEIVLPVFLHQEKYGEVRIVFSQEKVNEKLRNTFYTILVIALITVVLAISLAVWFIPRITDPLRALTSHAEEISKGDINRKTSISSDDEIGHLADAFNQMMEELQKTLFKKKELEDKNKALDNMGFLLAEVSHRIKNPLAAINNYLNLIKKKLPPGSPVDREVSKISEGISQIGMLLRSLSAPTSLEMNKIPIELEKIMGHAIDNSCKDIEELGIALSVSYDLPLPKILGDPERLFDAFRNLLKNAIDALEEKEAGEKRLTILIRKTETEVIAEVEDTGIGIPEEDLAKIFDPLFSKKGTSGGSGLGLYIVHTIIQKHHAKIEVMSQEKKGSHFLLRFPISPEEV